MYCVLSNIGLNVTVLNWALNKFADFSLITEILTGMKPAVLLLKHTYHELQIDVCMTAVLLLMKGKVRITNSFLPVCRNRTVKHPLH